MRVFFLGDAHVVGSQDDSFKAFTRFSKVLNPGDVLCIVGDFFNFFFGGYIPKDLAPVLDFFKGLRQKGILLYFSEGNREFFSKKVLEDFGFARVSRFLDLDLCGGKAFIFHGDGILGEDKGYRTLRPLLRNPFTRSFSKLLGERLIYGLGRRFSKVPGKPPSKTPKDYLSYSKALLSLGYRYVVMGHIHKECIAALGSGYYINPGCWFCKRTYVEIVEERPFLRRFE